MRKSSLFLLLLVFATACGLKVPTDGGLVAAGPEGIGGDIGTLTNDEIAVDAQGNPIGDSATGPVGVGGRGPSGAVDGASKATAGIFASETEGLTNSQITLCSHIPMTGAAPIPRHPDRFGKFYFDYVNQEKGGIHGRKVKFITLDDQYYPAGALDAVSRCKKEGTFIYIGTAGTDQIVAVAKSFAAVNKVPYLAGPASSKDLVGIPQVKMIGPDYESQHVLLADYLIKNAQQLTGKSKPVIGMLRVNSPFFTNGHDVFVAELRKRGYELAVDKVVQKDENQFTDIMLEMSRKGVDIINNFTTPNIWIKLLKQNNNPNYKPLFTGVSPTSGYNIIAAALADADANAVVFHHFNPPYDHTDNSVPYAADIQNFRKIFDKYSPERCNANDPLCPDDFDYSAYLGARVLERILLKAGKDLNRTKVWNMLDTYKDSAQDVFPTCPLDFTQDKSRGAHSVNVYRLNGSKWSSVAQCLK